jgi:hypothetical protein
MAPLLFWRMLEQYKRTFIPIQVTIWLVTVGVYLTMHHLVLLAGIFFVAMQLGAVFGAGWAYRLKRKVETKRTR